MDAQFKDFADLYRAAFAETNPDRKQILLADVKRVLDRWALSAAEFSPSTPTRRVPAEVRDVRQSAA